MDLFLLLLVQGIANGSHYALLGLGFGLIFATTNIVHFAYGPIFACAAYVTWACGALLGLPLPLAGLAGIAGGAAIGGATYLLLYRPFEVGQAPVFVVLIASLGLFIVLENLLGVIAGTDTKVLPEVENATHILELGPYVAIYNDMQVYQVIALPVVWGLLWGFLRFTSYGKAVLAMTDNAEMARIIGIDTFKVALLVFVIGSAISAVPAALILAKDGATTGMGFNAVFIAFVAVVVGGVGSLPGAVLGGFLLGLIESVGMFGIATEWQSTVAFVVLFLVLVFRPTGLFRGT
jgi:branched-chain amino acid transport system permease protein